MRQTSRLVVTITVAMPLIALNRYNIGHGYCYRHLTTLGHKVEKSACNFISTLVQNRNATLPSYCLAAEIGIVALFPFTNSFTKNSIATMGSYTYIQKQLFFIVMWSFFFYSINISFSYFLFCVIEVNNVFIYLSLLTVLYSRNSFNEWLHCVITWVKYNVC